MEQNQLYEEIQIIFFSRVKFTPHRPKHAFVVFASGLRSVVGFKQPTRAWKHTGSATFSGCRRVIVTDLVAQERKFVANSRLKKAEKVNFSWNLVPIKSVLLLPFFLKDPVYNSLQVSTSLKSLQVSTSLKTVQVSASQESISLCTLDISPPRKLLAEPATASWHANLRENSECSVPDLNLRITMEIACQIWICRKTVEIACQICETP